MAIVRGGRLAVVDSLENLRAIAIRKLEIEFGGLAPAVDEITALPGVQGATIEGSHFIVAYEGSIDPLVKAIAAYEVHSIHSRDDDLEEIFLGYYREGDQ